MNHDIIKAVTDFIFLADKPEKSDVIFLPGGSDPCPPETAARLYREGYAPLLIPSGKFSVKRDRFPGVSCRADLYNGNYETECSFFTDVLVKNGVPLSAIAGENEAGHTRDNADFSRQLTDRIGLSVKKALLVCKSFHARRSLCFYQLAFPETEFLVIPADSFGISRENWFCSEKGMDRVFGELERCGWQFLGDLKKSLSEKSEN